jgi:trehalose-phosphatase
LSGDRFLEVAPATAHKGQTVEWLLDHYMSRDALLIYCGDDDQDEEAFAVARQRGGIPIVVGQGQRTTQATFRFSSPDALRGWLLLLEKVARENHSLENF